MNEARDSWTVEASEVAARLSVLLGDRVESVAPARPGGWSIAYRVVAGLGGGRTVFVKCATTPFIAESIRREFVVYECLQPGLAPSLVAFEDDPERPLLVLEDLSAARWPPPWEPGDVERVLGLLERVWSHPHPPDTPRADEKLPILSCWEKVAADPAPVSRLGVVSAGWLDRNVPALVEAEREVDLRGEALLHCDVRSDNLCFDDKGALLVDWNWSSVGNERLDLVFWLPSLALEGGPDPALLAPDAGLEAALVAGYFAWTAPQPPPVGAPQVRPFQLAQLRVVLPWACRELGLEAPDGSEADSAG